MMMMTRTIMLIIKQNKMKPSNLFIISAKLSWPHTSKIDFHRRRTAVDVTQRQLMRLFAVKSIPSYEQKCQVRSKFLKN